MKLIDIEWKNIGSYGNKLQRLEFDDKGKLILLQGKSGSGKSTILNLTSILFYGKVEKMKNGGIVNRINKNGYVKGTIVNKNATYVIERTFSPNAVSVWKDGVDVNSIGVRDAQQFIIENVVGIPYQIFTNIISLSMTKFKSFLNMNPEDRRQIIDRVFSLEMVNEIYNMIKKDMRDLGNSINSHNTEIYTLTTTINNANQELKKLTQESESRNDEKISTNNYIIDQETKNVNLCNIKRNEFTQAYNVLYAEYTKITGQIQQVDIAKSLIQQKINLFNQDQCPTCHTSFTSEAFQGIKKDLEDKLKQSEEATTKVIAARDNVVVQMNQYKAGIDTLSKAISESNQKITTAQAENFALNEAAKNTSEYTSIKSIIDQNSVQLVNAKNALEEDNEKWNDLNTLSSLYSIEGVKKQVIKNYLPQLNKEIKTTLSKLDFPYTLEFDENFDNHLFYLNDPIPTDTLSEGEHKRVDLAVLCSIFKLLKRKYPSINIFTLDEVVSSIDPTTIGDILRYLKEFANEMHLNVFVVTHVTMETELFDEQITVTKEDVFSDMQIDFNL